MSAVEQYRRAVADAVEARARAAKLGKAAKNTTNENLRQRALTAWRAAQTAERIVREAPMDVIAEALAPPKPKAPILPEAIPHLSHTAANGHLSTAQMCTIVQLVDRGHTVSQICEATGRSRHTLEKALSSWEAGTSRCAQRAQLRGMWPSGRAA